MAHTHAGPDRTGCNAVARLDHEAGNLRALEANRIAPLLLRRSGDDYLRLSMDLSTGSAGILAALTAAEHASTIPWLPVVGASRPLAASTERADVSSAAPTVSTPSSPA